MVNTFGRCERLSLDLMALMERWCSAIFKINMEMTCQLDGMAHIVNREDLYSNPQGGLSSCSIMLTYRRTLTLSTKRLSTEKTPVNALPGDKVLPIGIQEIARLR